MPSDLRPPGLRSAADAAAPWLRGLSGEGDMPQGRFMLVVAHPDDEMLGAGSRLHRLDELHLIHVTPGAPSDDADAHRAGFADGAAYAAARAAELEAALRLLHARPRRRDQLGLTDGAVVHALDGLTERLTGLLDGAAAVMTHPYEGGHPDHDAVAAAVQRACRRLAQMGRSAPMRLEFASYHLAHGEQVSGAFWADPDHPPVKPVMTSDELEAKRAAFAAYASQAEVLRWFRPEVEAFRAAPEYDFASPPPPGEALYDRWGWALTSARWREAAGGSQRAAA